MNATPARLLLLGAIAVVGASPAGADPLPIQRRIAGPSGVALVVKTIDLRPASIVLSVTIINPGDRETRFNRARSFVLDDGSSGVHHLNPPIANPELRVPAHTQLDGDLVFIGPLAPAARQLTLSNGNAVAAPGVANGGGSILAATLPVAQPGKPSDANQVGTAGGVALRVQPVRAAAAVCLVSLLATNGSDRTIVLNQARSLTLTDVHGVSAAVKAPTENRELVVPAGNRLDAELVFDCRSLDTTAPLTLGSKRGTGGATDDRADALTVPTLKAVVERRSDAAAPAHSRATVAPISWSRLSETVMAQPAGAPTGMDIAGAPPASSSAGHSPGAPQSLRQLAAALQATTTDRGWRIVLPARELFGSAPDTLDGAAMPLLSNLAALATATHPSEVVVAGHIERAGRDEDNQALSNRRARAVSAWLEKHLPAHGVRFVEKGYGRNRPLKRDPKTAVSHQGGENGGWIEILLRR